MKQQSPNKSSAPERCDCPRCQAHDGRKPRGPFTPAEFAEVFGAVNEPPAVELSYELALLGAEVDLAMMRADRARATWGATVRRLQPLRDNDARRPAIEAELAAARQVLDEMNEALCLARNAYNARQQQETNERRHAEYVASQSAIAAERAVENESPASLAGRIRAKVLAP